MTAPVQPNRTESPIAGATREQFDAMLTRMRSPEQRAKTREEIKARIQAAKAKDELEARLVQLDQPAEKG